MTFLHPSGAWPTAKCERTMKHSLSRKKKPSDLFDLLTCICSDPQPPIGEATWMMGSSENNLLRLQSKFIYLLF
jgi:hypothetical protein